MLLMKAREKMGLPHGERILNMVFMGNPGTGKTMVCRLLGSLLKEIGILSKGHVVEVNRECLIGQYIGESEKRTKSFIEQAKGGILFIDEAYSLVTREDHDRDFGRRVLDTLMTHLSEPSNDLLVVMAGYTNEMKFLMNSNPGLASRFPIRFEFPDYTPEELMQICQLYFDRYHYQITDDAKSALLNILMNVVSIPNYGNGRYVKTLIENQIIPNMANRIASDNAFADPIALIRIEKVDIPLNTSIKEPYRKIGFNVE
jgi:stage V sporulation protein K